MKASLNGRERPRFKFFQIPHSLSRRLEQLAGKVAGELLRLIFNLTLSHGLESTKRSYEELGKKLGKSASTIRRATRLLLRSGDIVLRSRLGRSYCWAVLLEEDDILSDTTGLCKVRVSKPPSEAELRDATPSKSGRGHEADMTGACGKNDRGVRAKMTGVDLCSEEPKKPDAARILSPSDRPENEVLYISSIDDDSKIIHKDRGQGRVDDDPLGHKVVLKKLIEVGMSRRVARELLRQHDYVKVAETLEKALANPTVRSAPAYVISEMKDGGYGSDWDRSESCKVERAKACVKKKLSTGSDAPMNYRSASDTRAEMLVEELDKLEGHRSFRNLLKGLYQRYRELSDGLRERFKELHGKRLLEIVPKTPRRKEILKTPHFSNLAFRDIAEPLFRLVDEEGLTPELALERLAA